MTGGKGRSRTSGRPADAPPEPGREAGGRGVDETRLVLPGPALAEIRGQVEAAYPREGCGVLLGEVAEGERIVHRADPAENRRPERPDRYLVDPRTLRRLQEAEAEGGPSILGFFHSHPDAAPVPSETDREHAWPWYVYLIVAVRKGVGGESRAWELVEGTGFREREIRTLEDNSRRGGE